LAEFAQYFPDSEVFRICRNHYDLNPSKLLHINGIKTRHL